MTVEGMPRQALWRYLRAYYLTNRRVYPITRRAALLDAAKLTWKIRKHR